MTPEERVAHLEGLRVQLADQTRMCELLALIAPVCSDPSSLNRALRTLATSHIAFGATLRRIVDEREAHGETCHAG